MRTEEEDERLFFIGIGLVDSVNLDRLTHSANWKKTMKIWMKKKKTLSNRR